MKNLLFASIAVALLSVPATAQKMGSSNSKAPKCTSTIEVPGLASIELGYSGITWASGRWAEDLEGMKKRINSSAEAKPLGTFKTSKDIKLGRTKVPAGDYKLAFKLDDELEWELVVFNDDHSVTVPLELTEGEASKRLVLSLYAGDEDGTAGLYLAFGSEMTSLDITASRES